MTPEQIVRALAAADPYDHERYQCALCGGDYNTDEHAPDCPWRLAVEWVAAQNAAPQLEAQWAGVTIKADSSQPRGTFRLEVSRWQYRLREFDPTWPDAECGPQYGEWLDKGRVEHMLEVALADPERPPNREFHVERRRVTYGEAESCTGPFPVARP